MEQCQCKANDSDGPWDVATTLCEDADREQSRITTFASVRQSMCVLALCNSRFAFFGIKKSQIDTQISPKSRGIIMLMARHVTDYQPMYIEILDS